MKNTVKMIGVGALGLLLSGCGEEVHKELIVDGPRNAAFQSDLAACRQIALQKQKTGSGATSGAVMGGLVGGLSSGDGDEFGGMVTGAIVGGMVGSSEEGAEVEAAREGIVVNCMRGRGHKVVG